MTASEKTVITVATNVKAPVEKVWEVWNTPEHIMQWNNASPDWHTPSARLDLNTGGTFSFRMEAKDGSFGFDFGGTYTLVKPNEQIEYTMGDERKVRVTFLANGKETTVTELFEAESINSIEIQKTGWQSILDNFKTYTEYISKYQPLRFSIDINAPKKKVWNIMFDSETYKEWVGAAWPGSFYEGEWKEGTTMCFFNPDRSGTKIRILELRPEAFVMAEHISSFNKGKEDTESETAKSWIGSKESYTFTEQDGRTKLDVVMYVTPGWHSVFATDFPKALDKLKSMCEA